MTRRFLTLLILTIALASAIFYGCSNGGSGAPVLTPTPPEPVRSLIPTENKGADAEFAKAAVVASIQGWAQYSFSFISRELKIALNEDNAKDPEKEYTGYILENECVSNGLKKSDIKCADDYSSCTDEEKKLLWQAFDYTCAVAPYARTLSNITAYTDFERSVVIGLACSYGQMLSNITSTQKSETCDIATDPNGSNNLIYIFYLLDATKTPASVSFVMSQNLAAKSGNYVVEIPAGQKFDLSFTGKMRIDEKTVECRCNCEGNDNGNNSEQVPIGGSSEDLKAKMNATMSNIKVTNGSDTRLITVEGENIEIAYGSIDVMKMEFPIKTLTPIYVVVGSAEYVCGGDITLLGSVTKSSDKFFCAITE